MNQRRNTSVRGATRKGSVKRAGSVSRNRLVSVMRVSGAVFSALFVATLIVFSGWKLTQLPVERVVFSGDFEKVSREQLELLVSDSIDGGFLGVDIDAIRMPIEAQPWVFQVVVKRRWPSDLEIQVTEQVAIARWGSDSYLNHEGEVFTPATYLQMPELPRLSGPAGSQLELMQRYQYMRSRIQDLSLELVALHMDPRGGLQATLHTGSRLVFGRGQMEQKLDRFMGVFYADLAGREAEIDSIDLRYLHGIAVAWRTG